MVVVDDELAPCVVGGARAEELRYYVPISPSFNLYKIY